jgi:DNA mismatch endonuclease (patch repair protein)
MSNAAYWSQKVERNRQRDFETNVLLSQHGWTILRFWEHEDPESVADSIEATVRGTAA